MQTPRLNGKLSWNHSLCHINDRLHVQLQPHQTTAWRRWLPTVFRKDSISHQHTAAAAETLRLHFFPDTVHRYSFFLMSGTESAYNSSIQKDILKLQHSSSAGHLKCYQFWKVIGDASIEQDFKLKSLKTKNKTLVWHMHNLTWPKEKTLPG